VFCISKLTKRSLELEQYNKTAGSQLVENQELVTQSGDQQSGWSDTKHSNQNKEHFLSLSALLEL